LPLFYCWACISLRSAHPLIWKKSILPPRRTADLACGPSQPPITERAALTAAAWAGRCIPVLAAHWPSVAICLDLRRCGWVQDTGLDTVQAPSQAGEAMMAQKVTVALEDDLTGGPAD